LNGRKGGPNGSGSPETKRRKNKVKSPALENRGQGTRLRLDADVIAWLRRQGKGYQTRANALLRAAMLEDVKEKAS